MTPVGRLYDVSRCVKRQTVLLPHLSGQAKEDHPGQEKGQGGEGGGVGMKCAINHAAA